MKFLFEIYDWCEVWAPLIPLFVWMKYPKQPAYFKPLFIYLWIAILLSLVADIGWKIKDYISKDFYKTHDLPWLEDNNYLYNIHSVVRFICFGFFFSRLESSSNSKILKVLPWLGLGFVLVNFIFFESFFGGESISSLLFATEAGLLLLYCLHYFLSGLQGEIMQSSKAPEYWVVLGLSIYVVLNFFYFLFYQTLIDEGHGKLVADLWYAHNATFIILCIFIAKGFYDARPR